jgi:hypothetical protein
MTPIATICNTTKDRLPSARGGHRQAELIEFDFIRTHPGPKGFEILFAPHPVGVELKKAPIQFG